MKRLSILAIVLIVCARASAEMPKLTPPDPRLDKKITLDVKHTKLEEVAKSLSEQTGVTIKAGSGQRDWKVRESHVTIHANDVAAGKMLDQISRVLGFYVSREGKEGEWSYIIWQDKKSRDLESEMITAEKEAEAQRTKDMRQSTIDGAEKALKMSPDDAMKQKDKDPWTAFMGGTKTGRGFAGLLTSLKSQFPTEYDLMMRGKFSSFPLSGMQQAALDAVSGGFAKGLKAQMGDSAAGLIPSQLVAMPMEGMMGGGMESSLGMSAMLFISGMHPGDNPNSGNPYGGQPMTFFPMVAPNTLGASVFGSLLLDLDSGTPMDEANAKLGSKFQDLEMVAQMLAHDSPTEKKPPTDPELTREIEIKADGLPKMSRASVGSNADAEVQAKTLAEISRAMGMPVLFESFSQLMPISLFVKPGKQPLYKVLISVEKANYTWQIEDGALRIRPSDWALRRSYLVPESFIAYYKDLIEKQEMITLDDLAAIATGLTDDQIQRTLLAEPDLMVLRMSLTSSGPTGSLDLLRLYGSLNEIQKQSMQSNDGLRFSQLNDVQCDQLNKVITDRFGGLYIQDGHINISSPVKDQGKTATEVRQFTIAVLASGEEKERTMIQLVMVPGKASIAQMKTMRKQIEDKAKSADQKKVAPPAKSDAQKQPAPSPAK